MKKYCLITIVSILCMFNLFGQNKNETPKQIYKFKEPENTACITCDHVLSKKRTILFVTHDSDGFWQFFCGQEDHSEANAKVISMKQITLIDQSVNDLFEMPLNVGAERKSTKDKWKPFRLSE
jgi:hypothetical protein